MINFAMHILPYFLNGGNIPEFIKIIKAKTLPFPQYIPKNQINTITEIGDQIPVIGTISYQITLAYRYLLSVFCWAYGMSWTTENLSEGDTFWETENSAVLCKQKWHYWPQTNTACTKVAVFPVTGAKFPLLHPQLLLQSTWLIVGTPCGFGEQTDESLRTQGESTKSYKTEM